MKKYILFGLLILITAVIMYSIKTKLNKKYNVAIIQCASNKSLDLLANNFIKAIKKKTNNMVNIIYKNAEGSGSNALAIAQQLSLNKNIDLFFTIGSSVSKSLSTLETQRPIIIAGFSNPKEYQLDKDNICGTIDAMNEIIILKMILNKNPDYKKIGVLRTAGDSQERELIYLNQLCKNQNIDFIDYAVHSENEILLIMDKICQNIDCLIIPCDSLVVSSINYILKIAKKYQISVFTCFIEGVALGADGSTGVDYIQNGVDSAEIAKQILVNKKNPDQIKFKKTEYEKIYYKENI